MEHTLYKAAYTGDIKHVKEINDQQLNLIVTPNNNTILHVNLAFCYQPSSRFVYQAYKLGKLLMNLAFRLHTSTRFVEEVLQICPSLLIQVNDNGDTPLHVAAKEGLVDVVKVLIKHAKAQHEDIEANVTTIKQILRMTNSEGNTALHEAVQNHNTVDVVKLLMKEDLDFPYDYANNCGETPLYIAASRGGLDVVVEMLGTCTSAAYNYKNPRGMTILHAAVRRNHPDITKRILEKKRQSKEITNNNGWTLTKEVDENGWTPLHYAAYYGHHSIVKLLLKFDASAACIADNCRKMTALHLAAGQGYFFTIARRIIDSCPACLEQVDDRGWNYLHFNMCSALNPLALRRRHCYWENYLLGAKDIKGNTPLFVLASIGRYMFDAIKKRVRRELIETAMQSICNQEEQFHQLEDEVLELSKITDTPYKQGVVNLHYKKFIKFNDSLEEKRDTYLVVNALIATVSFTAGLTLPGGFVQEGSNKGKAILIKNPAFQLFIISNVIALVLSVLAVLLQIFNQVSRKKLVSMSIVQYAHYFTIYALIAMVCAFVTGTFALLKPCSGIAITSVIICFGFFGIPLCYLKWKLGEQCLYEDPERFVQ